MIQKATATATAHPQEFRIPIELLKTFQRDIRFIPNVLPNNGYIIFDLDMLTSVLRRGDAKAAAQLADHLEALGRAKGQLVIMQTPTEQVR